ncbi:MAG: hypothetical protein EP326_04165 [Deltaproteobacteria bacterium]|nr:MAG: hypothetical protein EP326_04165 [Deltaproteobacteria bacterium]
MNPMSRVIALLLFSFFICSSLSANVITKVKGNKILFRLKGLDPVGPGGVVTIFDSGVQVGKAKVTKLGKKVALATVYEGVGLVDKGYQVKVLSPGAVGKRAAAQPKKVKYNKGNQIKKDKIEDKEKDEDSETSQYYSFKILGTLSYLKMGEPVNGRAYDPTEYGAYLGYGLEVDWVITPMFTLFAGLDYHFASGVTTLPAHSKNLSSPTDADGNLSDIFLGTHIFLDKFDLPGVYFSLGYIFSSVHKLGTASNLIVTYTGSGLTFGGGYEFRTSGPWVYQLGIKFNRYSYGEYDNNTEEAETIEISQNTIGLIFRLGYQF